jgi:hypothetical protein
MGRIDEEAANSIGMRAGGIRLEPNSLPHMNRRARLKELKKRGFNSARDAVNYVACGYQRIYRGKGDTVLLVRCDGKHMATFVQLIPDEKEHYYRVNTVLPVHADYLKNKPLLWERAQTSQTLASPPSAVSGQSKGSDHTIAPFTPQNKEHAGDGGPATFVKAS